MAFNTHKEVSPFHRRFEPLETFGTAFQCQLQTGSAHVQALSSVLGPRGSNLPLPILKSLVLLLDIRNFGHI